MEQIQMRGPTGTRTTTLLVLGLMLLSPFVWVSCVDSSMAGILFLASACTSDARHVRPVQATNGSEIIGCNISCLQVHRVHITKNAVNLSAPSTVTTTAHRPGGENNEQRSLLDTPSQLTLAEPRRSCRSGDRRLLPKLITIERWLSTKTRPRESISMLTQLSADRVNMLENQCRTWSDPIIATIYVQLMRNESDPDRKAFVPTHDSSTSLEDVKRGIASFHEFMESTAQCALRIELVGQYVRPEFPRTGEYPINALRNKALALAQTELVLVLDVDFVASPMLGLPEPGYRDPAVYNQMVELADRQKAIVLPAFEITNRRQELSLAQNFARNLVIGELFATDTPGLNLRRR
jgi:hypothetical protein